MFFIILFLNALTDHTTGYVYDILAVILLISGIISADVNNCMFYIVSGALFALLAYDKEEKYLGQGDYLILLSLSLNLNEHFPHMLMISSTICLVTMLIFKKKSLPLVPYLFLGTIVTETVLKSGRNLI